MISLQRREGESHDLDANFFVPDRLELLLRYTLESTIKPSVRSFVEVLRTIEGALKEDCRRAVHFSDHQGLPEDYLLEEFFHDLDGGSEVNVCWIERPFTEEGPLYGGVDFGRCLIGSPLVPEREVDWFKERLSVFATSSGGYRLIGFFTLLEGASGLKEVLTSGYSLGRTLIVYDTERLDEHQ